MAGPPLINNRTQRSCSRLVAREVEKGREKGKERTKYKIEGLETMKRDVRTRVVLSAISVSLPLNRKGVGRSRG